ncbi:MAG: SDR family oxidoreductase [Longimicrobiales bacterium]
MKTVVVTGGAKGIGADITRAFHAAGYTVVVGSRSADGAEIGFSDRVRFRACDVRRPEELHALADFAVESTGRLDAWVNNAGFSKWCALDDLTEDFVDDMIRTNLHGVIFGCQAAARRMPDGGVIVNVSSLAGRRGSANNTAYCASKFGVTAVTQSLAKELGGRGIRVNAVCPVYVVTAGLTEALQESVSPSGGDQEPYLAEFARSQSALGRLPTGGEVADAVLFLTDGAHAVTAQSLNVDCGVMPF